MVSAFSVPKAKRQEKYSNVPGPGEYNPQKPHKIVKNHDPQYSFGKDQRRSIDLPNPGPGAYEPKNIFTNQAKPSYSMVGRRQMRENDNRLGPGQYEAKITLAKEKSPAYSLYGRGKQLGEGNPLGPGQYAIKRELDVIKKHGIKFSKEDRNIPERNNVPGPGSYDHLNSYLNSYSQIDPSYGFGSRLNSNSGLNVPGPGTYEDQHKVYSKIGGIMSRDMKSSLKIDSNPGPGNYQPQSDRIKRKLPSWSLSKSSRDIIQKSIDLGPGQYDHDKNFKSLVSSSMGNQFSNDQRLKNEWNAVPGPGSYDHSLIKSRKNIKIAQRLNQPSSLDVPGPGSYQYSNLDVDSWVKGKGRYSIGKDSRDRSFSGINPGPGAYDAKLQIYTPLKGTISFSRDNRLKSIKNVNPGPGEYNLKPFFADVPKYLLPDRH